MTERLVEGLEVEARYRRERLALYRAKVYGSQPTSPARLRKLEQASDHADQRLRRARRDGATFPGRAPSRSEGGH